MKKYHNVPFAAIRTNGANSSSYELQNLCIIGTGETADRLAQFCEYHNLFNIVGFAVDKAYLK